MKKLYIFVLVLILPFCAVNAQQIRNYVPNQMIIQFDKKTDLAKFKKEFSGINFKVVKTLSKRLNLYLVEFDDTKITSESALVEMKSSTDVKIAQFNHFLSERSFNVEENIRNSNSSLMLSPNDPQYSQQWALNNFGQNGGTPDSDIDAPEAWDLASDALTALSDEIVIAIIDNQFDLTHNELEYFVNYDENPGNGIDDDGNGYIDDYRGWNAYNSTPVLPNPVTNSHGTSVSGVAGAKTNNNTSIASISWGAKIMPIAGSSSTEDVVVAAYAYAHEMRALYNETNGVKGAFVVVTNSSFGVDQGDPEDFPIWCAMYDSLGAVGIVSVGGAPNSDWNVEITGDIPTRCTSEFFIGVTNTTNTDGLNSTAGYGNVSIDLGAPGTNILTTVVGSNTFNISGTSVAAPHVSGTIALMYSAATAQLLTQYRAQPAILAKYMRAFLLTNVDARASLAGKTATGGRLNAYKAVLAATVTPDATPPTTITNLAISQVTSNSLKITFTSPSDASVYGVIGYDIRYSLNPINNDTDFLNATQYEYTTRPRPSGNEENIFITSLNFGTGYYIAIKAFDLWSNYSALSNVVLGNTWGAPDMDVDPLSILNIVNQNITFLDTIRVSNTTAYSSTLDYNIQLKNNTFPTGTVSLSIKPDLTKQTTVNEALAKGSNRAESGFSLYGSGGPDTFGYEWIDSDDPNGPAFVWNEIDTSGTEVTNWTISSGSSSGPLDDGYSGPLNLGFNFKFYGTDYSQVYLNTNGLIMFSSFTGSTITNVLIPNSILPNNFIAPLWRDLDGTNTGKVYYKQESDRFIIEYKGWRYFGTSKLIAFQVVLFKDGKIIIYYGRVDDSNNGATVGIENSTGTDGLLVAINSNYLKPGLALQFSAEPEWLAATNLSGTILNSTTANVVLEFTSQNMSMGNYSMDAVITSNDPSKSSVTVKVEMIVSAGGAITRNVEVSSGWNIISVPVAAANMTKSTLFPSATSDAFKFAGIYVTVDTLLNSAGYWLKFASDQTIPILGNITTGPVAAALGWNLIGPFERYVDVSGITTNPAGSLSSDFFGFDGIYFSENLLEPGKGYWIKTSQACNILYNTTLAAPEEYIEKNTSSGKEYLSKIAIPFEVKGGVNSKSIKLTAGIAPDASEGVDSKLGESDLPPKSPGFDARFSLPVMNDNLSSYSDYRSGDYGTVCEYEHVLNYQLEDGSEGLQIDFNLPSGVSMNIRDLTGGKLIDQTFFAGKGTFSDPKTKGLNSLKITLVYDGTQSTVQLASFDAVNEGSIVSLYWKTLSETKGLNFGIERKTEKGNWQQIGLIEAKGNSGSEYDYMFSDKVVNVEGNEISYRLKLTDADGMEFYTEEITVEITPQQYVLEQNYPNPFNPATTIKYALPFESSVKLTVYNALGEKVDELVNKIQPAGYYEVNWRASDFASGIYIYVIETRASGSSNVKDFRSVKKMMLIK